MIKLESTPLRPLASVLGDKKPIPQYYCKTCGNLADNKKECNCFHRPVQPEENKCFNHTNYIPFHSVYQPVSTEVLEEITEGNKISA